MGSLSSIKVPRRRCLDGLGRLANMASGAINPSLRKVLIHLYSTDAYVWPLCVPLEYELTASNNNNNRARRLITAQVFTTLLSATDHVIKLYAHSFLNTFLPKVRDLNPSIPHMIESIGLLGSIAGEGLVLFVREIPPLFISTLQDLQAARKRNEALLRAFNQVCARTGSVIDVPIQNPELFGAFRKFLSARRLRLR